MKKTFDKLSENFYSNIFPTIMFNIGVIAGVFVTYLHYRFKQPLYGVVIPVIALTSKSILDIIKFYISYKKDLQ